MKSEQTYENLNLMNNLSYTFKPIGLMKTVFKQKNGIPRQSNLCPHTKGVLNIDLELIQHSQYTLEGLENFSHVWLIWIFHGNNNKALHPKVSPPRLEGQKVGLFATRTPHRPNPIGMSVAKIQKIEGCSIHFTELDLLDGTPVLDIKPYIPKFDSFPLSLTPEWIDNSPKYTMLEVKFDPIAESQLKELIPILQFYDDIEEYKLAIAEILTQDPRATHYKKKDYLELYGFCLDYLNILSKFDDETRTVTVMKFENWKEKFENLALNASNSNHNNKF